MKIFTKFLLGLLALGFSSTAVNAQLRIISYSENFTAGTTYCPGTSVYDNWVSFRAGLDTNNLKFGQVSLTGDNNATAVTGRTCSDAITARRFANAIRQGIAYNVSCGGFTWDVGGAGTCIVGGGCANATDQVSISVNGAGTFCSCANPAWYLNPCIGNANWAGAATNNCPPPSQRVTLTFSRQAFLRDIGFTRINALNQCNYTQNITATVSSAATTDIDSFQYYVRINTTTYGPYKAKFNLKLDSSRTFTVMTGVTFSRNTIYNIRVWSANPNYAGPDTYNINDTARATLDFRGTLSAPVAIDTTVCGSQRVRLRGIPAVSTDPLVWFRDRNASNVVGYGTTTQSPFLASGATYKFWVGSYNGLNTIRAQVGGGTNGQNGAMFDIRATTGDITVDSLYFESWAASGNNVATEVYLRQGSYNDAGAAGTATMWSRIWSGNVRSRGIGNVRAHIPVRFTLTRNQQYSVYVVTPNETLGYGTGGSTTNYGDITVTTGLGISGVFGGTFNPRSWNGSIFYSKPFCPSALDSAIVVINPAPFGARMAPGIPFQTSPKKSGNGTIGQPQVVALGDTLAWDLQAPTGYNNAGHTTTWQVKTTSLRTSKGRAITNYTWTDPTSSRAGRFVYTPNSTEVDTVLVGTVTFQDKGLYNCDSTVTFYMYVAPLPVPNFTRTAKVCDGQVVEFTNKSSILSGFFDTKWYFGDGDSSEANDPVYAYKTFGTYYVRLNATSSIYGYVRTKRDTLIVTQIPAVNFKVTNACEKLTHSFQNLTTVSGGTLSYKWNFGDGSPISTSSASITRYKYSIAKQYQVTLTAEANGCQASLTKNAYLFPKPKASFTVPQAVGEKFCSNGTVEFINTSTLLSGNLGQTWNFADGNKATIANPEHQFASGGKYNVQHIAISEFGCADTAFKEVTIGDAPKVAFTNGQVCDQTPTQFTNNTPAIAGFVSSPKWSFGDGATSGADNPTHQYTVLGPKTVKLVVSVDNGCKDSVSKELSVGIQAIVDFEAQATCSNKPVQFTNKTTWKQGSIVYEWDFGDGSAASSLSSPVHTYTTSNSFTPNVKLRAVVDGACASEVTKPLQVYELPTCAFTITDDWTPGEGYRTIRVQAANSTYPFYRFKFSDGGSINTASGTYQFPYEGDFTVSLFTRNAADCECNSSQVKSIRGSVGTIDLKAGQTRVFPNPSNGILNVESGSAIQNVEVFNLLGERVLVTSVLKGQNALVTFGNVANGVYLVKVITTGGTSTTRVTVNK